MQMTRCLEDDKQYQVAYFVQNDWVDGFTASVTITNVSSVRIEDWSLEFSLGHKISQIWNGEILKDQGGQYVIGNEGHNSHMLCELSNGNRGHVYYEYKEFLDKGLKICALDVDETNGYGPETTTMYYRKTGWYQSYIFQFSPNGNLETSNASVHVYLPGKAHPSYTFHVPIGKERFWNVFRFNSATQRMVPINTIIDHM